MSNELKGITEKKLCITLGNALILLKFSTVFIK